MKKKLLLFALLNLLFVAGYSQIFNYAINLNDIVKDEITVKLDAPKISSNEIIYYFPKTVPGTYAELDYGRYVSNFTAKDANGNKLKVKKIDINSYLISNASTLKIITYKVKDTFDEKVNKKKKVFEPAGTGFEDGKYFVLNTGGIFGCFEKMESNPIQVDFAKSVSLKGYSSLAKTSTPTYTHFSAKNYHQLIDSPILFTNQKVEQLQVGNCTVTISSYSENEAVSAIIKKELEPIFDAIQKFTGALPVKEYNILLFIEDQKEIGNMIASGKIKLFKIPKIIKMMSKGYGALEHGTSSLYFLPDLGNIEDINYTEILKDVVTHEFMHIYTPLNLHSDLVGNFNYRNPKMSQHLWLYEGVTEYFSIQIQMQGGIVKTKPTLKNMRNNIIFARNYPDSISFTKMSTNVFDKPYKDLYQHVYDRGAVMAMLLDFEIMKLTDGEKTLKAVVFELSKKYGQNNSFDENTIITEFVVLVHPDLQHFFDAHITGTTPLDLKAGFDVVGINYDAVIETTVPIRVASKVDNGVKLSFVGVANKRTVKKVKENDIVGFQKGDKVDKRDVFNCFIGANDEFVPEGTMISLTVVREDKDVELSFPATYKEGSLYDVIKVNKEMTPKQKILFNLWSGK